MVAATVHRTATETAASPDTDPIRECLEFHTEGAQARGHHLDAITLLHAQLFRAPQACFTLSRCGRDEKHGEFVDSQRHQIHGNLDAAQRRARIEAGDAYALRLDVAKACALLSAPLTFIEHSLGEVTADPSLFGDVVLARKDTPASYHLAVVVDDALQGITLVTRGEDLLPATHLHRLLQHLLGLPVPEWHHHRLITDETGKRLAKRDNARSLKSLREAGWSPQDVKTALGPV
jgi:glutamyl/glutaminyl-tRNA synthetase